MEIRLGESIRKLRKDAGLSQEQLAEAMGVSVSAVHKWESGKATPELEKLVDIADFFETSVDAMLNYGWQTLNMGQTSERINTYKNERNFEEGIQFAERALQKYPNSFDVVYESALLYYVYMFQCQGKYVKRTIELFEKAIQLIDQNKRESVCVITIQNKIADCYCHIDDIENAVSVLKQNNVGGLNDAKIGLFMSQHPENAEQALKYLSDALHNYYAQLYDVCMGYANAYGVLKKIEPLEDIMLWLLDLGHGLKSSDAVNIVDKTDVRIYLILAGVRMLQNDEDGAEKWLKEAKKSALRFDSAPEYRAVHGMKYYHGNDKFMFYDDMGENGMAMIDNFIKGESAVNGLSSIWDRIR